MLENYMVMPQVEHKINLDEENEKLAILEDMRYEATLNEKLQREDKIKTNNKKCA